MPAAMKAIAYTRAATRPSAAARPDIGSPTLSAAYTEPCMISIERLTTPASKAKGCSSPKNPPDRKSTRLNSSHDQISYAVFCLEKKKHHKQRRAPGQIAQKKVKQRATGQHLRARAVRVWRDEDRT